MRASLANHTDALEQLSKNDKIKSLDEKLAAARRGEEVEFTADETRKLYGRVHTALKGTTESSTKAAEVMEEAQSMTKGKDAAKKAILNAWCGTQT